LFLYARHHPALLSCPTRRSSDLITWPVTAAISSSSVTRTSRFTVFVAPTRVPSPISRAISASAVPPPTSSPCPPPGALAAISSRSEEHTSELQSRFDLVCRLLLE